MPLLLIAPLLGFRHLLLLGSAVLLVMVATDSPEQKLEIVRTLQHYRLGRAESWVFADSYTQRLRFEADPQWYGELPRTYFLVLGHSTVVSGKIDYGQFEQWIKSDTRNG